VLVRLRLAFLEGDAEEVVAHDVLALGILTEIANLDLLVALLTLRIEGDHFGAIPSRTASVR